MSDDLLAGLGPVYRPREDGSGRLTSLLPASSAWMTREDTAERLGVAVERLNALASDEPAFHAIERRSRSTRRPNGQGQGAGLLYARADVEQVAHIKRTCRLRLNQALRVFAALREGRLSR